MSELAEINKAGFLTINSQPNVNAANSSDPIVGWGGAGGYIYQKVYFHIYLYVKGLCSTYKGFVFNDLHSIQSLPTSL